MICFAVLIWDQEQLLTVRGPFTTGEVSQFDQQFWAQDKDVSYVRRVATRSTILQLKTELP